MISKVTKVFDTFIRDIGGNLDPRSNNNKCRVALCKFWATIQELSSDGKHLEHIQKCMEEILNHKLTYSSFQIEKPSISDETYRVFDYLGNEIEDSNEFSKEDTLGV